MIADRDVDRLGEGDIEAAQATAQLLEWLAHDLAGIAARDLEYYPTSRNAGDQCGPVPPEQHRVRIRDARTTA